MKEQLEKDLQKQKKIIVLAGLSLIFSIAFVVYYLLQKDNKFWGFVVVLAIDLYELPKEIKKYKEIKSQLQE